MQVTFRGGRQRSGRRQVPARVAGGTCNHGGRGPGPSDTPPPRPGLPGRRALTCPASGSPHGLSGLGCADRTALGTALGVPRGARRESGGRRRPGRRRRRTPALRSGETHPPPGRSAAAAPDHFRGTGERGGAPAGTSCPRGRKGHGGANKSFTGGADQGQWDRLPAASWWLSPSARRKHLSTPGRGSGAAAPSSSQDTEGLLGKGGEGEAAILLLGAAGFSGRRFSVQPATWLVADQVWGGGLVACPAWRVSVVT